MVKVENKETLRLLTRRFMKMNRARNVIAVIAIMLTSLLFTSLSVSYTHHLAHETKANIG